MTKRIITRDKHGRRNGWLLPLWNVNEKPDLRPDQVYVTSIDPGCSKGPHLHMKREQRYYCISGKVVVETGRPLSSGAWLKAGVVLNAGYSCVVPAGHASEIINQSDEYEAVIVNMPSPAWKPDDQDDWPVERWDES